MFFTQALADAILATYGTQLQGRAGNLSADSADAGEPAAAVLVVDLGLPYGTDLDIIRAAQRQWLFAKKSTPKLTSEEVRNVRAGGRAISPQIARQLLTWFGYAMAVDLAWSCWCWCWCWC